MSSTTKQANFLLPEELLDELKRTVDKRQQSRVVSDALRKELKRIKLAKAFESSFGAWKDKDHPEIREGVAAYVRKIRKSTRGKQGR
jgi:hypothetical protein